MLGWTSGCHLFRPIVARGVDQSLRAIELITKEMECQREEVVREKCLAYDTELIHGIPLCQFRLRDRLIWPYALNGEFALKLAYARLTRN